MITSLNRRMQQMLCMTLAAMIVSIGLSVGMYAAQAATHPGYSVTVTQLH